MATKPHMNLITVGHVDHGKSTLVGRLLFDSGNVTPEEMRKLKELTKELKKETFEFAFQDKRVCRVENMQFFLKGSDQVQKAVDGRSTQSASAYTDNYNVLLFDA